TMPSPTGTSVAAYYERWIVEQEPHVRRAQLRDYKRHLTGYVLPILGTVEIAALTVTLVDDLKTKLLLEGRPRVADAPTPRRGTPSAHQPLAVKTVRNIVGGSFRAMLRHARKRGLLTRDQFTDLMDLEWPDTATPEPDPFT